MRWALPFIVNVLYVKMVNKIYINLVKQANGRAGGRTGIQADDLLIDRAHAHNLTVASHRISCPDGLYLVFVCVVLSMGIYLTVVTWWLVFVLDSLCRDE